MRHQDDRLFILFMAAGAWIVAVGSLVLLYMWMMHMAAYGATLRGKIILGILFTMPFLSIFCGFLIMKKARRIAA